MMNETKSILSETRKPTNAEERKGAQVVFERKRNGVRYTIFAAVYHESWRQWGAPAPVLTDNIADVEAWIDRVRDAIPRTQQGG